MYCDQGGDGFRGWNRVDDGPRAPWMGAAKGVEVRGE